MAPPVWALVCLLALGAQTSTSETCPGGDVACLPDGEQETAALLQHPTHRRVALFSTNVVSMNAENSTKPPLRLPMPTKKRHPETLHDCEELYHVFRKHKHLSQVLALWRFMCSDEARERLAEMTSGCLYVPPDHHLNILNAVVDHPNPWHFHDMFEDSFFPAEPGHDCPTGSHGAVAKSLEGTAVKTCSSGHGFMGVNGKCIRAHFVGKTRTTGVRVFKVDGLLGLDKTWEDMVVAFGEAARTEEFGEDAAKWSLWPWIKDAKNTISDAIWGTPAPAPTSAPTPPAPAVLMKLKFFVCDSGDGVTDSKVSDDQVHRQVRVLQRVYSGQDRCKGEASYHPPHADVGFRFTLDGIVRVTDPDCANDCSERMGSLTSKFAKREDGMVKVILCATQLLGIASFPGYPDSARVCIANPDTLPGGAMGKYNSGKTVAHELGHYLGAYHTFQGGCGGTGDGVTDTDAEQAPNYGCPGYRAAKTCGGDSPDPVHNIMDYSDDKCMCSFTPGQREVMWEKLQRHQPDLLAVPVP